MVFVLKLDPLESREDRSGLRRALLGDDSRRSWWEGDSSRLTGGRGGGDGGGDQRFFRGTAHLKGGCGDRFPSRQWIWVLCPD